MKSGTFIKKLLFTLKISLAVLLLTVSYNVYAEYYLVNPEPEFHCYRGCEVYRPCYYKTTIIHSVAPRRHQPRHAGVSEYEWIGDP